MRVLACAKGVSIGSHVGCRRCFDATQASLPKALLTAARIHLNFLEQRFALGWSE